MSAPRSLPLAGCVLAALLSPSAAAWHGQGATPAASSAMQLHSPDFTAGGALPARLTCDGAGASPALHWSGTPAGTRSFALVVDDPDAPGHTWVHWVLYDLPADSSGLPQGVRAAQLPHGTREGQNDWQKAGFGAPCPPVGRHRYVHTLYALDAVLPDLHAPDKAQLLARMQGHVLATARLVGTYQRAR